MQPLVVLVEFMVKPGFAERFGELVLANAEASLKGERGCRRFDVLVGANEPRRFVLYEIYDDDGAFDLHMRTQHYRAFAKAIDGEVEERSIRRLSLLGSLAAPDATGQKAEPARRRAKARRGSRPGAKVM